MKLARPAQRDGSTAPPKSGRTQARPAEPERKTAAPKSKVCLRLYLGACQPSSVLYVGVPDVRALFWGACRARFVFGARVCCARLFRLACLPCACHLGVCTCRAIFFLDKIDLLKNITYCRLRATHRRKPPPCFALTYRIASFGQPTAARHGLYCRLRATHRRKAYLIKLICVKILCLATFG